MCVCERHNIKICIYYICYIISTTYIKYMFIEKDAKGIHSRVRSDFLKVVGFQMISHFCISSLFFFFLHFPQAICIAIIIF